MSHIVTISRHIMQKIIFFHPKISGRISIIHHGINLDLFKRNGIAPGFIRDRFNLAPETVLISTSGSMWKNQIEFLDALVEIRKEIPAIRYLLLTPMADMPHLRVFKDRAAELGVADAILWLETLPKEDMPSYYADIDLAVSTFRNEGFGIWVVESLAMGTPVVAFDEGGVRDSLEGCAAAVLIRNGAKEMAAEIIRVVKDKEAQKRMSDAGPRWVAERFGRERMIEEYHRFFGTLIESGNA